MELRRWDGQGADPWAKNDGDEIVTEIGWKDAGAEAILDCVIIRTGGRFPDFDSEVGLLADRNTGDDDIGGRLKHLSSIWTRISERGYHTE